MNAIERKAITHVAKVLESIKTYDLWYAVHSSKYGGDEANKKALLNDVQKAREPFDEALNEAKSWLAILQKQEP